MRLHAVALATLLVASGSLTANEAGHDGTSNASAGRPPKVQQMVTHLEDAAAEVRAQIARP